ncbi:ribonuclease inhibitor [Dyadobacter sp. CY312]|uniref:barstar family protein n=1 Tax=Dyadobacter sp. CY312 TaxID=2907303 RepID=UPI001F416BCA|nr:ribonuclease inhibitor [Dyadobacter sp. CY312]MCE7039010.1 ribonuclease inhibitor [Dyadobacter sp. CY312]
MTKKTIVIDGNKFDDLAGFYEEINNLFMSGIEWRLGHSLDALNDILYGGFGVFEPGEQVLVIWKNSVKSTLDLGTEETVNNYQMKVDKGLPYNVKLFKDKLEELRKGTGQTLYQIIIEIFEDHKNIELRFEA